MKLATVVLGNKPGHMTPWTGILLQYLSTWYQRLTASSIQTEVFSKYFACPQLVQKLIGRKKNNGELKAQNPWTFCEFQFWPLCQKFQLVNPSWNKTERELLKFSFFSFSVSTIWSIQQTVLEGVKAFCINNLRLETRHLTLPVLIFALDCSACLVSASPKS